MASTPGKPELLAIVGPTASGKTALSLEVAKKFHSEIITADSRTIYKDMDIGTAKPSISQRKVVPHWGLDLVVPGDTYSAQRFKTYAVDKIDEIKDRGNIAILVGGTGLYITSILYDYGFTVPASQERESLEKLSVAELQEMINGRGFQLPENRFNKRHLVRAIERAGATPQRKPLRPDALVIGLMPPDEVIRANIEHRAEMMFKRGVVQETKSLVDKYGRAAVLATGGIIYKICLRVLDDEINEQTAATLFKTADWQYVRRQKTWYKNNNDISWFVDDKQALKYLNPILNT